jgi:hypothetical protein
MNAKYNGLNDGKPNWPTTPPIPNITWTKISVPWTVSVKGRFDSRPVNFGSRSIFNELRSTVLIAKKLIDVPQVCELQLKVQLIFAHEAAQSPSPWILDGSLSLPFSPLDRVLIGYR